MFRARWMCGFLLLLSAAVCSSSVYAQELQGVPAPLAAWLPWVRADDDSSACVVRAGEALCFWPGPLELQLQPQSGHFRVRVHLDRRQVVALPGGAGQWPTAVRVSAQAAPVVARAGIPTLDLPAGEHAIDGQFVWRKLPDRLLVPASFGLLQVSLAGQPRVQLKRDATGSVWLHHAADGGERDGPEQLELTVARKLVDGVPLTIESRIRIRAAGAPREISLGRVLVPGSTALSIDSELPVRLAADGELRLQVRAGSYGLRVLARTSGAIRELTSRARPAPWPAQEAWVFQPDAALRQVRVTGAPAVDPARLELDADLRGLPTFLLGAGDKLTLEELRRGEPEPPPNQLSLERTLWLDQDGRGYTVHDVLGGELHSSFRLELREGQLGRALQAGQDQLITQRTAAGALGVELRDVNVALQADSRLEQQRSSLPAVGWSEDVHQLALTLNLPPGYALWGVQGVDRVEHTWLGDWDLLGFFFVVVVAFATVGVAGRAAGVLAFLALTLSYQEADAPSTWWLGLLVAAALLRVLPRGRLWQLTRVGFGLVILAWLVTALPFAARSVREALYPQLGQPQYAARASEPSPTRAGMANEEEAAASLAAPEPGAPALAKGRMRADSADSYAPSQSVRQQQDPEAVVQTGPGLPDWQFRSWRLSWSGPVAHDHHIELILIPPLLQRLLCLLRVALCAWLLFAIVRAAQAFGVPPSAPLTAAVIAALVAPVHAQFPEQKLLEQLRERALRPAACRPDCVTVSELAVEVGPAGLSLSASVHAQDASSVRLPGPLALWTPERVSLDHEQASVLAQPDGFLHVRVPKGVHVLESRGAMPLEDTVTLRLGDSPQRVSVHATGYEVSGVREDGSSDDAIELRRTLRATEASALSLPPWFLVTRSFELANEFRVHTVIERQTPRGTPQLVHLPLLPNESIHDARVQVSERQALIAFAPDDERFSFESTLTQTDRLELEASPHDSYAERWQFFCASMWQCQAEGLVPIHHETDGRWQPQFSPYPGEHLRIALHKPTAAKGQTTTLDGVKLTVRPGVRATDAELQLSLRTSRGGDHTLELPAQARVSSFTVAGTRRATRRDGGAYGFSVLPGRSQIVVAFELPSGMGTHFEVPQITLTGRTRNARVAVELPDDRWLLWARGPAWGPAILFWGQLLLALGLGWGLSRVRQTPLRTWDWWLLAAGLTQVDGVEALCIVSFLFALAWRARTVELGPWRHNLVQVVGVVWLLAAGGALFDAVRSGLLVQPDMQVMGAGSHGQLLQWYVDDSAPALPTPEIFSVPIWVYRVLMLAWSLWLARQLLRWAPWVFRAFAAGGLWKKRPPKRVVPPPSAAGAS